MKKYKRKTPLVSPVKFVIGAFYAVIAAILIYWLLGSENNWSVICLAISVALFVAFLFLVFSVGHAYVYGDAAIRLYYFIFKYGGIKYQDFSCICISNASYNNGYGYGIYGNIPMKYKSEGKVEVYPFLTVHKLGYPVQKIKATMNSRDLFMFDSRNIVCLGICWYDSLVELLDHTNVPVYVLEDVYLRFREGFDTIFKQNMMEINRFYIITDRRVGYETYLQEKHLEKR